MLQNETASEASGGRCWLCRRPLGRWVERHHPVPRSRGGRETVPLHPICHRAIHANFTRWRSVRFSGFFHSAYRARRSASAGPVDTVERRPWAHP
jgi:hypothetical protein